MTYNDFLNQIKERKIETNGYLPFSIDKHFIYTEQKRSSYSKRNEKSQSPDYISQYWSNGGACGGNCWNDNDPESDRNYAEKPPTTFKEFDDIVELFCPTIPFMKYRELSQIIESGEATEYQYYGNYDLYGYNIVLLEKLYSKMIEMELIKNE